MTYSIWLVGNGKPQRAKLRPFERKRSAIIHADYLNHGLRDHPTTPGLRYEVHEDVPSISDGWAVYEVTPGLPHRRCTSLEPISQADALLAASSLNHVAELATAGDTKRPRYVARLPLVDNGS